MYYSSKNFDYLKAGQWGAWLAGYRAGLTAFHLAYLIAATAGFGLGWLVGVQL